MQAVAARRVDGERRRRLMVEGQIRRQRPGGLMVLALSWRDVTAA